MRTIKTNPGIGDSIWLFQKLLNSGEQFNWQISDGKPQRGKQIFDLLPQLSNSCTYVPGLRYSEVKANNVQEYWKNWSEIQSTDFYLSANDHLEKGRRLEEFLPDLETTFKIDWATDQYKLNVEINFPSHHEYIGLYGSAYSTVRSWGFWDEFKWFNLVKMVHNKNPDYVFVVIGAEWDNDLGRNLVNLLQDAGIKYINTIGESLGTVIEIMKRLKYFFSFPSGLGILAPTVNCPVTMFYPEVLKHMPNTWASSEDIETGRYKGCMFCEPEAIFKWVKENKWI